MATHVYVVSINKAVGDAAHLEGTVDGTPCVVDYWLSATTGMTLGQAKTFIADPDV